MIKSFSHKGLKMLWEKNNPKGVDPQYAKRLRGLLTALDAAETLSDLSNTPGLRLHPLKGDRTGDWSMVAYANYRITFRWIERQIGDVEAHNVTVEVEADEQTPQEGEVEIEPMTTHGDPHRVNLEDYHSGHH